MDGYEYDGVLFPKKKSALFVHCPGLCTYNMYTIRRTRVMQLVRLVSHPGNSRQGQAGTMDISADKLGKGDMILKGFFTFLFEKHQHHRCNQRPFCWLV